MSWGQIVGTALAYLIVACIGVLFVAVTWRIVVTMGGGC